MAMMSVPLKRLAVAALVVALLGAGGAAARIYGERCDVWGIPIEGRGPKAHVFPTYRLFVPAFYGECLAAQGKLGFTPSSTDASVRAAWFRDGLFWGTDRPLTTQEKSALENDTATGRGRLSPVHQIPLFIDGIAIATNVACSQESIKLRSAVVSLIYSGVITRWNDPAIVADNPQLADCSLPIRAAIRADGGRETTVLREYLAKRNKQWEPYLRPELAERWPATLQIACRGRADAGMATCVAGTPGSIGYVSLSEATRAGLSLASVENVAGQMTPASAEGCTEAAAAATAAYPVSTLDDWSQVSFTDAPGGYPICNLHLAIAFHNANFAFGGMISNAFLRTLVDYLGTIVKPSVQAELVSVGYARLPDRLRGVAEAGIDAITYDGLS